MRKITAADMEEMALGAAVLGTGGGGDPYVGKLIAIQAIKAHGPVTMIEVDELDDDALVVTCGMIGAPTVMVEKIPRGDEIIRAVKALEAHLGRKVTAIMSIEAGGVNSTVPFAVAAILGLPIVDADGMGRAFPEIQMVTMSIYGIQATPFTLADDKGNTMVIETTNNLWTERFARTATVEMGCSAMDACYAMTGKQLKQAAIPGTMTLTQEIGQALKRANKEKADPIAALLAITGGFRLFRGKVNDVRRATVKGFARGEAVIEGVGPFAGQTCRVQFQNEHMVAMTEQGILASTPDLITVLDAESGEPITTEGLRYGFRVEVLGIPCNERWRTPKGLELVGPGYFGYDFPFVPVEVRNREA